METPNTKFLILLGILIWLKQANAINCYSCLVDDACKDPFKSSGVLTLPCNGSCYKVKATRLNIQAVGRGCEPSLSTGDECTEATEKGITGTVCLCKGNLCNNAVPLGSAIIVTAASIIIFIALH